MKSNRYTFRILIPALLALSAAAAAQTFDSEDFFLITPNSNWHYTGEGQPGSSAEDDFTWTVLPTTVPAHGTDASQIETTTDEPTDDRNGDRDFWSYDVNGNLFFHGFHNAEADGGGAFTLQPGDYFLDEAFLAGSRNVTVPAVFQDEISISNGLPAGVLSANLDLSVEYLEFLPSFITPLCVFTDVLHVRITINVASVTTIIGPIGVDLPLRVNEFYLVEGVSMIAQDQNADPNDAQLQALDGGQVNGVAITCPGPACTLAGDVGNFLLGLSNDPTGLNLNGDGVIDVADAVTCVNQ